jgi:glycine/D-amino acid oxidase-like deaminating enzyme
VRVIVVGAGINGVISAIELRKRGHDVDLIDPGPLPHPLAASTDISKAVRAAYGADEKYTELAARVLPLWPKWNEEFGTDLYHEVGFLFMRQTSMGPGDFEHESLLTLERHGRAVVRMDSEELRKRFPAWKADRFPDGFLEREAGYVESARAVSALIGKAESRGVRLRAGARFLRLDESARGVTGVVIEDGDKIAADKVLFTAGAWTPYLLPFTRSFFRSTGHPVFHLQPRQPEMFRAECFPVFGADISKTGYYGFPLNRDGVVKIARHGPGREMSPDSPDRVVTAEEESDLREFVSATFPALVDAPIVHTRVCMYCDTHDGNFWIAPDPDRAGLTVCAGDSGHGFKFAPVLGAIIADAVEGKANPLLENFRWRPEVRPGAGKEAARFRPGL